MRMSRGKLHVPKGFMCLSCTKKFDNCSHLPFDTYRPLVRHKDGVVETKCEEFNRS
jgi:hypothetical protein